jgi:manganese/zinc/iron transport system substrate-binding protein
LSGCVSESPSNNSGVADLEINAVSTVAMVGDLVEQIGGEHLQGTTLLGSGVDPHLYKATADDFRLLKSAEIIFSVGLMLEGRLQESLKKLGNSQTVLRVAELLDPSRLLAGEHHGTPNSVIHPDPHVWLDVELWSEIIAPITDTLSAKRPQFSTEFQSRASGLRQELRQLHDYGKQIVGTIPLSSRVLITSHDAFQYFGRAYGLEVLGLQGISTESEAGLLRVNELVDLLVERRVAAVFVETSVPRKSLEALIEGAAARGHHVRIGGSLFSDAMGADGTWEGTYAGMLDHNLTTVTLALGGSAPPGGFRGRLGAARKDGL